MSLLAASLSLLLVKRGGAVRGASGQGYTARGLEVSYAGYPFPSPLNAPERPKLFMSRAD